MKNLFILILGFFNLKARYTSAQVALLQQQLAEANERVIQMQIQLTAKNKHNKILFKKLMNVLKLTWSWSNKVAQLRKDGRYAEAQGFSKAGQEVRSKIDPDLIAYSGHGYPQSKVDEFLIERGIKKDLDRTA